MSKIKVSNLSFYYEKDKYILKDINVEAGDSEFICILGQSGCGKSTFLRLLGGLETPVKGSISINDKEVTGASLNRGIVFQDYGLFPWMSAGDNILLALEQKYKKTKTKDEMKQIALDMLKKVGLEDEVFDKLPNQLSGGMKQRCAIAQSFSIDPPILLMDEPFGALDAVTRTKLQDLVINLWKNDTKKTVFFVTHDVDEAIFLSTRIIVLGQSPSYIIEDCKLNKDKDFSRQNQFTNKNVMELRNKLIELINSDITSRV